MKLTEVMDRSPEEIGVVVSTKQDGTFYDISVVDYNTQQPVSGHYANLEKYFIQVAQENDAWDQVMPFFKSKMRGKPLGGEYSDEAANFYMFGPVSPQQLSGLSDEFEEYIGASE